MGRNTERVHGIVEKRQPRVAPSTLAMVLMPRIFRHLEKIKPGGRDSIDRWYRRTFKEGIRYDCGSKLDYLKAQVALGLKHQEFSAQFESYLQTVSQ